MPPDEKSGRTGRSGHQIANMNVSAKCVDAIDADLLASIIISRRFVATPYKARRIELCGRRLLATSPSQSSQTFESQIAQNHTLASNPNPLEHFYRLTHSANCQ